MVIWILGGLLAFAVAMLVYSLVAQPAGQSLVDERLGPGRAKKKDAAEKQDRGSVIGAAVDRAVEGRGFAKNLATQLARADWKVTVGEFIVLSVTIAIGASLIFYLIDRVFLVPVGILVGIFGPRLYIGIRKNARLKKFDEQLGDALNLMVNSLRAGYSTLQAMEVISREMPDPIAVEFGRVVLEIQLGVEFDRAMANLLRRMPSGDMDLVITAMSVQREVGGNLAEVLDAISFTIRERVRIKGEIKALTAQGRITGIVITLLPFLLVGLISFINPSFMAPLFEDACGWIMMGVSVVMIIVGYIIINKITDIEV